MRTVLQRAGLSALLLMGAALLNAGADENGYPLTGLDRGERSRLRQEKPVIKVLEDTDGISLQPANAKTEQILERFGGFDPNFLAEAFFVLPVKAGSEAKVLEEAKWFLQDVTRFEQIPYHSARYDKWYPMFVNMKITALPIYDDGSEGIVTSQKLKPFRQYTAQYRYDLSGRSLLYTSWNDTPLIYKGVRGVAPEEMYTALYAEAREGEIFFYGLGGAKAFTFFGLFGDRLDQAFTGRVEAFFSWFYREFVYPRLESDRAAEGGTAERGKPDLPAPYNDPPELE